jgi:predicted nucleotide-binding protein
MQRSGRPATESQALDPCVWVISGYDEEFRITICDLLRSVSLRPICFDEAIVRSGSGSPNDIDAVLKEMTNAPALVCLLTPDDRAELRREVLPGPRIPHEADAREAMDTGFQPRPNILLTTGMALAAMRDRTVIVTLGPLREVSSLSGLHAISWRDDAKTRHDLLTRLEALGCPVDREGGHWLYW